MVEATRGLLEEDEGEADSTTSEMMVASSLQLFLALLLCPSNLTTGKVQLCDLTPHCSLLRRRHDWGASRLLLCTVFWYGTWTW